MALINWRRTLIVMFTLILVGSMSLIVSLEELNAQASQKSITTGSTFIVLDDRGGVKVTIPSKIMVINGTDSQIKERLAKADNDFLKKMTDICGIIPDLKNCPPSKSKNLTGIFIDGFKKTTTTSSGPQATTNMTLAENDDLLKTMNEKGLSKAKRMHIFIESDHHLIKVCAYGPIEIH